ncbi:MAG: histidinol dehydrogenase [Bacteroidales bacterium]|nr:histidinol dehydrogenase [Bacteroidales bacterium]
MESYIYPQRKDWSNIVKRASFDNSSLRDAVSDVLSKIKNDGDKALFELEEQFDKVSLTSFKVNEEEFKEAENLLSNDLKNAIDRASINIEKFHASQKHEINKVETSYGVICWQKSVGIDVVGLYIPGGTAPLFSTVLMLAVPAKIAGCRKRVLCTPPNRNGKVHPAILYAAMKAGVTEVYKLGGIQAIGAMAYGTESVPKVYKIFGPGNQYVTMAKQLVSLKEVAIDMPAGPSEVAIIADESADAAFVASDFLSQAEHGSDSQALLFTTDKEFAEKVKIEVETQLEKLPRKELTSKSLEHSKIIVLTNNDDLMELVNEYAPEHLIIQAKNYNNLAERVVNAGSVFLGPYTPESAGDYASGTNHTLPTNGYAKAYSGVNLDSFIRKITFQEISKQGLEKLGPVIEIMAENESLIAHKRAVSIRLNKKD